ncbi:MAG TPA: cold shock domain-containing protein [Thermomicrobiales bacterium]|jgi:cold shock CspA family protein|nr:cold shock domain-containing protein [Thermomicrobiales bacterium]
MLSGYVDRLDTEGRFGFITGPNGEEYFFHQSALSGTEYEELAPGTPVDFDTEEHAQGDHPDEHARAINVRLGADAVPAVDNEQLPVEKITGISE